MKMFAIALAALLLVAGGVPVAVAQQDASSQSAAPQSSAPSSPGSDMRAPGAKAPDAKVDVDIKGRAGRDDDAVGSASPRTGDGAQRTGFFGLSPTAAVIVSVAVLLVVILAIVAMTNSRGTTYVDRGDRGL